MIDATFLAVCIVVLVIQVSILHRLHANHTAHTLTERIVHRGLLRTSSTRVLAAVIYVGLGLLTVNDPGNAAYALIVFTVVQAFWISNAILDVQLRRQLARIDQEWNDSESPERRTIRAHE